MNVAGISLCTTDSATQHEKILRDYYVTLITLYRYSNSDSPSSLSGTSSICSFHRLTTLVIQHPHSFIPGIKPSLSANPSHRSLPFLLPD